MVALPRAASGHRALITPLKPLKPTVLAAGFGSPFDVSPVVVPSVHPESTPFLRQKGAHKKG